MRRTALLLGAGLMLAAAALALGRSGDEEARKLRDEIAARWGVVVVDRGLDQAVAPLAARPAMPMHMADLPPAQEEVALGIVREALAVYPAGFVRRMLHQVVLAGDITVYGQDAGGLYYDQTVAINFRGVDNPATRGFDVDTLHHELSSIVRRALSFNVSEWEAANPPGFHYMDVAGYRAVLADPGSVEGDPALHRTGFVSRYGQTTLDNDWNTYAERVFGHPEDLVRTLADNPAMRGKARMLMEAYLSLDAGFKGFFDRTGLTRAVQ